MIELIKGLPDKVIGIVASGRVTDRERNQILLPVLERTLAVLNRKFAWHTHPRLYLELKSGYPGPWWDDLTAGLEPLPRWERVAVVTDSSSIRDSVMMLRLIVPGQLWAFTAAEAPEALAWITADLPPEFAPTPIRAQHTPLRKRSALRQVSGNPRVLAAANDLL